MKDIRIAAVVSSSPVGEIRRNVERMVTHVAAAEKGGANMVCFPELNITGYCNRKEIKKIALSLSDPVVAEVSGLAVAHDMVILAGMAETDGKGTLYATHLVLTPDGRTEVYRKLHIAPPERAVYTPGKKIPVFEALGVRFGIQLCYDTHFPELSTRMAESGAEILFMPHASPRGDSAEKHASWMRHLPARAFDNSVFVVACNQQGENCNGLTFPGLALVIDPSGKIIADAGTTEDKLLFADLKKEKLDKVRGHEMRYFFPNRKPELYT